MNLTKMKFNVKKKEEVREEAEPELDEYWVCCQNPDMYTTSKLSSIQRTVKAS